uniref:Pentraxin family member n=1 Tax=Cyprinodon variegatus TaxID=28743 RepID=A0A3Q2DZL1_CYPVA
FRKILLSSNNFSQEFILYNLSGKMFTFPQQTSTTEVRFTTQRQDMRAVTVCLRSFTDLKREHSLFSLALPTGANGFLIIKSAQSDAFDIWVREQHVKIEAQDFKLNMWQSICATWDASSGLIQLWLNGKPSSKKYTSSGHSINGPMIIVLGQDQDSYGGGFDTKQSFQSFVGMMEDVHMWDYTLSPCEIQGYMDEHYYPEGNVLNWNSVEFQSVGRVLIEEKLRACN